MAGRIVIIAGGPLGELDGIGTGERVGIQDLGDRSESVWVNGASFGVFMNHPQGLVPPQGNEHPGPDWRSQTLVRRAIVQRMAEWTE